MQAPNSRNVDRQEMAHMVAAHYAKLGWHVTPGVHEFNAGIAGFTCSKHPTVKWNETDVREGRAVGATTNATAIKDYWLGPISDRLGADICIHAKPSKLVIVDCDRAWKQIVVEDENGNKTTEQRWIDGLATFLGLMGEDVGTNLIAASKRGLHFCYSVDTDLAAKVRNRNGWLPGVDVRGGGPSSGGVTIETNGVCPHRRWVHGTPRIAITDDHPEGVIAGLEDYSEIEFDEQGNCIAGLPTMVDERIDGLKPLPAPLLEALLVSSRVYEPTATTLARRHNQTKRVRNSLTRPSPEVVDARASTKNRPYELSTQCTCGRCVHFEEAIALLAWVPPEVGYETWRNVLWGLSDLLSGSSCGAELAAEWSSLSIVSRRCNPEQARSIYGNDRRILKELLR